jgi:hypothetical protein
VVLLVLVGLVTINYRVADILTVLRRRTNLAILAFALLALCVSFLSGAYHQAPFWFGVKTDLGFLLAFILAQFASANARRQAVGGFIAASSLVAAFAVLQVTVLPVDFLTRFGYGQGTIEPFALVDPAVGAIRVLSTLGGPNQLGSFLILPACLLAAKLWQRRHWAYALPLALVLHGLWHSYSRSAWIGMLVALGWLAFSSVRRRTQITLGIGLVLISGLALVASQTFLAGNTKLEYYLLHGQVFDRQLGGSDVGRLASLRNGAEAAAAAPLGKGLGTAGPASYHGNQVAITENFYLQLALETGFLGLLLFGCIVVFAGRELSQTGSLTGKAALAALVGLSVTNLFLHTWADSSTALTFWIISGLAIKGVAREV